MLRDLLTGKEADARAAERQARATLAANPDDGDALRLLGVALYRLGDIAEAERACMAAIMASLKLPLIAEAVDRLARGEYREAEALIRRRLAEQPEDALALTMMGDLTERLSIYDEAERYLRSGLELAPAFEDAQLKLGFVLLARDKTAEALAIFETLLARNPDNRAALKAQVRALVDTGEYARALAYHERLIALEPRLPTPFVAYGHTLKTLGRPREATEAYRHALALDPRCAEAWWALSNMKAGQLDQNDVATMEARLRETPPGPHRMYLHFALGKALEDSRDYAQSFHHYAAGNRERLALNPHHRKGVEHPVDRTIAQFDAAFLRDRVGAGTPARDPIFILGMPRAGSTLLEQILSSHPAIEGTAELPLIPTIVRTVVSERWRDVEARYPEVLATLALDEFAALGLRYLDGAARHRKTSRPFVIDKLPGNWMHIGLIHLMLPNATIIDARREPMACCFANFKQYFARGQSFAYDLGDVGHYYRQYVRLVDHFDMMLPGRVLRLQHEDLLENPEREVRRLLASIGLEFDPACLRFYENARPVRTPSAQQVRRPINRDAVDLWRNYEPWLGDLKQALGPLAPQ